VAVGGCAAHRLLPRSPIKPLRKLRRLLHK
jgi:hypothetical protein